MTDTIPVTIRIPQKFAKKLDKIAEQSDRSRNYVINQAILKMVEMNEEITSGIKEAIEEMNAGKGISIDEVFSKYEQ
jgi:predicted transcriptional regulator